ncbi:MAG: hypothetical protein N2999_00140 [Proteobacteria bacterium]|nr:hypothetical protein [Pseudomonadota bacterium]
MKKVIFLLIFISAVLFNTFEVYSQDIRKIPLESTPVFKLAKDMERRLIDLFPLLYLENKLDSLEEGQKERVISIIREKDLGMCFNLEDEVLNDFCRFYVSINLLGVDSDFSDNLHDPFLLDLAKLAKAISLLKEGEFQKSEELFKDVTDKSAIIFFRDLSVFFQAKRIEDIAGLKNINLLAKKAVVFKILEKDTSLLNNILKPYIDEDLYNYFTAVNYFKSGNYVQAGEYFLHSAKEKEIKEVALYNAVYSFFLARNFKNAGALIPYLSSYDNKKFTLLLSLTNNKKDPFNYDEYVNDRDFWYLLRNLVRFQIEREGKITFLKNIKMTDIKQDEELLFFYCVNLLIIDRYSLDSRCKNYKWNTQEYGLFFKDISDNVLNRRENIRIIENYRLFKYFPFSKYYGDYLFRNNNYEMAKNIYEEIIREERKLRSDFLVGIYSGLSKIYKTTGSSFTAKKILEEGINRLDDKKDILFIDFIKILIEEENYEEVIWRAKAYLNDTENEEIKKELQKFIEICYERLDKLKKKEK